MLARPPFIAVILILRIQSSAIGRSKISSMITENLLHRTTKPIFHWNVNPLPGAQRFCIVIPTCWYQNSLRDPTQTPADPTQAPTNPMRAQMELVEYCLPWAHLCWVYIGLVNFILFFWFLVEYGLNDHNHYTVNNVTTLIDLHSAEAFLSDRRSQAHQHVANHMSCFLIQYACLYISYDTDIYLSNRCHDLYYH